ncbi:hypothetical protein BGZ65_003312, partial [Modicella reniformis]
MKFLTILSAVSIAALVSAGTFYDIARFDNAKIIPGAFIVEYLDNDHLLHRPANQGSQRASGINDLNGLRTALASHQV